MKNAFSPEVKFCVRYLLNHGVNSLNFTDVVEQLGPNDNQYELIKSGYTNYKPFFEELAEKLRELWPPGEKMGKYPWRDSVNNLAKRLEMLWKERFAGKTYTVEECLVAARRYLSQFEDDVTYMQTLKYFILKQEPIAKPNGHLTYVNKSKFADMLESNTEFDKMESEIDALMNSCEQIGEIV